MDLSGVSKLGEYDPMASGLIAADDGWDVSDIEVLLKYACLICCLK